MTDVFENFRSNCIEIYEPSSAHFLSVPWLVWQDCLQKSEVKLELLIKIDILLMAKKGIQGGICHAIHRYAQAKNQYMKINDK